MKNIIHNEDNLITMAKMPDDYIDCTITSPPYDKLRDYKGYTWSVESMAKELYRITKPGGVVVWVVGDATIDGSETGTSFRHALTFLSAGFLLHDTMIFEKNTSSMPSGVKSNRYTQIFEYMFVFSKGKPKTTNLIRDKKNKWAGTCVWGKSKKRSKDGSMVETDMDNKPCAEFGIRNNIWRYVVSGGFGNTKEAYKHPATFPLLLVRDHLVSWTNENDLVYDPFMGSGTTAVVCIQNNRQFIGSEISKEYCELANSRINNEVETKFDCKNSGPVIEDFFE